MSDIKHVGETLPGWDQIIRFAPTALIILAIAGVGYFVGVQQNREFVDYLVLECRQ